MHQGILPPAELFSPSWSCFLGDAVVQRKFDIVECATHVVQNV